MDVSRFSDPDLKGAVAVQGRIYIIDRTHKMECFDPKTKKLDFVSHLNLNDSQLYDLFAFA